MKSKDPKLPKPTYQQPLEMEVFKSIKQKESMYGMRQDVGGMSQLEEIENKMNSLNLESQQNQKNQYD